MKQISVAVRYSVETCSIERMEHTENRRPDPWHRENGLLALPETIERLLGGRCEPILRHSAQEKVAFEPHLPHFGKMLRAALAARLLASTRLPKRQWPFPLRSCWRALGQSAREDGQPRARVRRMRSPGSSLLLLSNGLRQIGHKIPDTIPSGSFRQIRRLESSKTCLSDRSAPPHSPVGARGVAPKSRYCWDILKTRSRLRGPDTGPSLRLPVGA